MTNIRQKIAMALIWIAALVHPCRPGFCFIKNLHSGWCIIDGCMIRQTACPSLKNGITWEAWKLMDEWQKDLKGCVDG